MLKAASMFYSMIPFLILLCSFFQNCGAPKAAVSNMHMAPLNPIKPPKKQLGSSHGNQVSLPRNQNFNKSGIGLTVNKPNQAFLHTQAKQGSQDLFRNGKNLGENGMFNFNEHNSGE